MVPNIPDFRDIFPEFSEYSDTKVNFYLSQAIKLTNEDNFGELYSNAVYLLTAHFLVISDPSNAKNGAKTSERAGDLSVGYSVGNGNNLGFEQYKQTQYGLQYLSIMAANVLTINVL